MIHIKNPRDPSRPNSTPRHAHRRPARAAVTLVLTIAALLVGVAAGYFGGYYWFSRTGGVPVEGADTELTASGGAEETWYTCGMHPNVLQKEPGDCPICHMKLTPLKKQDQQAEAGSSVQERKILYWRAPMDPNYISDRPGKSPMGMDLVPVYADEATSASAHMIRIDPVTIQNMGIRTAVVRRGPLVKIIRTIGRVDYNEELVTFFNTKVKGWIETLYVDETGQFVARGDPLFDIYSPELYAAQEEYLAAIRNLPLLKDSAYAPAKEEAQRLVEAAVTKLRYMDVSDEQIATIRDTQRIEKTLTIHSPADGIVTEKMALTGMYVMPGMRLYTIADLSRIWVYVDIYEYQLPWVYVGQSARMTLPYIPGKEFTGKVVYIYPYLESQTRVIKVRLEFDNPMLELKPGMYANVKLESELSHEALLVPREAYIDSGERKLVFVDRGEGKFEPREVMTGVEAEEGMVEVLYGLDEGEVIVTSGQFLLDAESKLKEAVAKMMEAERAQTTRRTPETAAHDHAAPGDHAVNSGASERKVMPKDAAYACPMESHPDAERPEDRGPYFSSKPGSCPLCGMKLKPLEKLKWTQSYEREP